jgi:hypothetical protein
MGRHLSWTQEGRNNRKLKNLHNDELYDLSSSPSIIRMIKSWRIRRTGYAACIGEKKNACNILFEKPEGKRPPERPRCRGENNIKTGLRYILCWGLYWSHLAQDGDQWWALCNTVIGLLVPENVGKFLNN